MSGATLAPPLPYVGPRPFEASDRSLFFGREREAHEISSLILATKFFALYAASGAGKTSLFNAGIRPLLEEELEILPTARFQPHGGQARPGVMNVYTYAALAGWASAEELGRHTRTTLAEFLAERPRQPAGPDGLTLPRLLVFDQFEELFTTHPDRWEQRRQFLEQLAEASDSDPDLRVLIIMRDDFLARLLGIADTLFSGLKDRYFLEPLRKPSAEQAIAGPVHGTGRAFEPRAIDDLVWRLMITRIDLGSEQIVQIQGQYVEPVLLQVVCQALWAALPADITTITLAHVRDLADVNAALGRFYSDAVWDAAGLGAATETQIRTWVAQRLVTRPGGTRGTVYAGGESVEGLPAQVVARLEGKLLRAEFRAGARWLELTHDSLLAPIERSNAEFFRSLEQPLGPPPVRQMADQLAVVIARQWQDEGAIRRLNDPYPLPVRWAAAGADLARPWEELVRVATIGGGRPATAGHWAAGPRELAGEGHEIADVLARIPTGRLVVLGPPGSGKTALMIQLVLELLARRRSGDRVPVLLPAASWDPSSQDLRNWIAAQLVTNYQVPPDSAVRGGGRTGVHSLLDAGLIMPILDGLDEIPDALRAIAIAGINDALRPGDGIVVTSRSPAYRAAARGANGPEITVSAAAVIELQPPSAADVAAYLKSSAGGPAAAARWDPVLARLGTQTPLTLALSTPLMVSLASTIYNARPGVPEQESPDPAELLNQQVFQSASDIDDHLFDAFIRAVYGASPGSGRGLAPAERDARRWLTFLARHLDRQETTQLAWWRLRDAAPGGLVPVTVGVLCGITAGIISLFKIHPGVGFGAGVLAGLIAGLLFWPRVRGRPIGRGIAGGLMGSVAGALAAGLAGVLAWETGHAATVTGGLPAALAVGLGVGACFSYAGGVAGGLVGGFTATVLQSAGKGPAGSLASALAVGVIVALIVKLNGRAVPATRLTWSMPAGLGGGLGIGLAVGLVAVEAGGLAFGLSLGIILGVTTAWPIGLTSASADLASAPSPRAALARDTRAFWVTALAAGISAAAFALAGAALSPMITAGHSLSPSIPITDGLGIGIAAGLVLGLLFGVYHSASPSFLISRIWLSLRGQSPLRLMRFLDDAHRRGVLRQNGAVYEFRHLGLQRHLAAADQDTVPRSRA